MSTENTGAFFSLLAIYNELAYKNELDWEEILYKNGMSSKNSYISAVNNITKRKKENDQRITVMVNDAFDSEGGEKILTKSDNTVTLVLSDEERDKLTALAKKYRTSEKNAIFGLIDFVNSMVEDEKKIKKSFS